MYVTTFVGFVSQLPECRKNIPMCFYFAISIPNNSYQKLVVYAVNLIVNTIHKLRSMCQCDQDVGRRRESFDVMTLSQLGVSGLSPTHTLLRSPLTSIHLQYPVEKMCEDEKNCNFVLRNQSKASFDECAFKRVMRGFSVRITLKGIGNWSKSNRNVCQEQGSQKNCMKRCWVLGICN